MKRLPIAVLFFCLAGGPMVQAEEQQHPGLDQLHAAAQAGNADAQLELGILYEYGFRKPDHLVPALSWYLRAATSGNTDAARRRDALVAKLKPDEVEQAKRLAQERPSTDRADAAAAAPTTADPAPTP